MYRIFLSIDSNLLQGLIFFHILIVLSGFGVVRDRDGDLR